MQTIRDAWAGLDNTGRIVLIVALSGVAIVAIVVGLDLTPYLAGFFK
jgi:hypothetical protein